MSTEPEQGSGTGNPETQAGNASKENHIDGAAEVPTGAGQLKDRIQILFASVTSKAQLEAAIAELPYTADTAEILRESLPSKSLQRGQVLNFAADILVDAWEHNPVKAGQMATLLSQAWIGWHPETTIIVELVRLCEETIKSGNTAMVAVVQPTAFVLGALGHRELYRKWLQATTMEASWREADLKRNIEGYYASRENQLAAVERHLADKNRAGTMLRAHDIGLVFQIGEQQRAEGLGSDDPEVQRTNELLTQVVKVLEEEHQDELLAYIRQHRSV